MKHLTENLGLTFAFSGVVVASVLIYSLPVQLHVAVVKRDYHNVTALAPLTTHEEVLLAAYRHGWLGEQWKCLRKILNIENPMWGASVKNKKSDASGIFQNMKSPSGKMARDYSIAQQSFLGTKYIEHRYYTPCKALLHETLLKWY